jgi:hypothetical protein
MLQFIEIRAMAGMSYLRAQDVIAVQHVEQQKCTVLMAGGLSLSCSEPAKEIMARVQAALRPTSETPNGHGSS